MNVYLPILRDGMDAANKCHYIPKRRDQALYYVCYSALLAEIVSIMLMIEYNASVTLLSWQLID